MLYGWEGNRRSDVALRIACTTDSLVHPHVEPGKSGSSSTSHYPMAISDTLRAVELQNLKIIFKNPV